MELFERGTFFLPGPTEVHPEVLQAMTGPMMSHRSAAMEDLWGRLQRGLGEVLSTPGPVVISTSSATGLMEAGVRAAGVRRVLCLVNGAFSGRFANIARRSGLHVDVLEVPWGEVHEGALVAEAVRAHKPDLVTVVHCETSTGALNPVGELLDAVSEARPEALKVVDSVSGAGGAAVDPHGWGADFLLTGSQKALALPPGLAFGVASERMVLQVSESQAPGLYFDLAHLVDHARLNRPPTTPAISLLYALDVQLERISREGFRRRLERHTEMASVLYRWVADSSAARAWGMRILAPEGARSPTVTTLVLGSSERADEFVQAMADQGVTIGSGYGSMKKDAVRIGHMGDHTPAGIEQLLQQVEAIVPGPR